MNISMSARVLSTKRIEKADLEKMLEEHQKWLKDRSKGSRAILSGMDLSNMDLSGMDFSYAEMMNTNLMSSNLSGANFSSSFMPHVFLHGAKLDGAILDSAYCKNADISHASVKQCSARGTIFTNACAWDSDFSDSDMAEADFILSSVCDCDFSGCNLEKAYFAYADLDNAVFRGANLKEAKLCDVSRAFWSDFSDADMTGATVNYTDFDEKFIKDAKGLHRDNYLPEEGSFIAWKMCREGRLVKLLIPENAERKGYFIHSCRASEAKVLEIYDKEGNPVDEAISIIDESFKYIKGDTAIAKDPGKNCGDAFGIFFVLSRSEAERYRGAEEEKDDEDDVDED